MCEKSDHTLYPAGEEGSILVGGVPVLKGGAEGEGEGEGGRVGEGLPHPAFDSCLNLPAWK